MDGKLRLALLAFVFMLVAPHCHAQREVQIILSPYPSSGSLPTVQGCGNYAASGGQTSITCTFSSAVSSGDVLGFCLGTPSGLSGLTWSGDSGTFAADVTAFSWNGGSTQTTCVTVAAAGGGGTVITASFTSIGFPNIIGFDIHNSGALDQKDAGLSSSGTTITSNSITPGHNNETIIGIVMADSGPTITVGSGYTQISNATNTATGNGEYQFQTTAAAITATWTLSASHATFSHILSFQQ